MCVLIDLFVHCFYRRPTYTYANLCESIKTIAGQYQYTSINIGIIHLSYIPMLIYVNSLVWLCSLTYWTPLVLPVSPLSPCARKAQEFSREAGWLVVVLRRLRPIQGNGSKLSSLGSLKLYNREPASTNHEIGAPLVIWHMDINSFAI